MATHSTLAMLKSLEAMAPAPKASSAFEHQNGNCPRNFDQGNVCGPIVPLSNPFQYFFVLVDASSQYADFSLLSTQNLVFSKLLAMILKLQTHYLIIVVKMLRMDNATEFRSHTFKDYCTAFNIRLTFLVLYEHSQNGLAEAYIKKL